MHQENVRNLIIKLNTVGKVKLTCKSLSMTLNLSLVWILMTVFQNGGGVWRWDRRLVFQPAGQGSDDISVC